MSECRHDYHWYSNFVTEAGWKCCLCNEKPGEPPGFSPALDRAELERKVCAVMSDLHDANFIYISNGSGGDMLTADVVEWCRRQNRFDQGSIAFFILATVVPSHAKYWGEVSEGVIAGKDPRRRCHCGRLSTMTIGDRAYCSSDCQAQKELPW